jgi:cytoskeletal protein CcmA (bactofilin family)
MLKKDKKLSNLNEAETVIGESVQVKGDFESNGDLIINGSLEGEIKTKGFILVGEMAKINANISAEEMTIDGEVRGDLKIRSYLSVKKSAKIFGDIECLQIAIEKGAEINGQMTISKKEEKNSKKEKNTEKEDENEEKIENEI